jgi:hypothetical protein
MTAGTFDRRAELLRLALLTGGGLLVAALLIVAPVLGVAVSVAAVIVLLVRSPGAVIAVSWSGFWLYLAALDVLDIAPRSAFTALAYAAIALGLGVFTWSRRATLIERLRHLGRWARWWLGVTGALAAWFVLIGITISDGPLAHRLLGLFVISTIPTMVAAVAATPRDLEDARSGLVVLGLTFLIVDAVVALHSGDDAVRFSPVAELDPINAALIPAWGCVAAATYRFRTRRGLWIQLAVCVVLAAGTALPHARGPVLTLGLAIVFVAALRASRNSLAALAAVAAGIALGLVAAQKLSTGLDVLGSPIGAGSPGSGPSAPSEPISSFSIRRQWIRSAIEQAPDRPLFGHGIGMFVDRTPEAGRMGVAGQRVYPHNDIVESAYSLGLVGLLLFAAFIAITVVVGARRRARGSESLVVFALGLFAFAFLESNFSGEIGSDVVLWSSAAVVVLGLGVLQRAR